MNESSNKNLVDEFARNFGTFLNTFEKLRGNEFVEFEEFEFKSYPASISVEMRNDPCGPRVLVADISISKEKQGGGLGTQLMKTVVSLAEEKDFRVSLGARPYMSELCKKFDNVNGEGDFSDKEIAQLNQERERLRSWYERLGFECICEGDLDMPDEMLIERPSVVAQEQIKSVMKNSCAEPSLGKTPKI